MTPITNVLLMKHWLRSVHDKSFNNHRPKSGHSLAGMRTASGGVQKVDAMEDIVENAKIPSVMDDPSSEAVAKVYASAYLNAAGDRGDDAVEELESFVNDVLGKNAAFANLLLGGLVNSDERVGLVDRAVKPFASEFFVNFLKVLAHHERLGLIRQIFAVAKREQEKRSGKQRVQVQRDRKSVV